MSLLRTQALASGYTCLGDRRRPPKASAAARWEAEQTAFVHPCCFDLVRVSETWVFPPVCPRWHDNRGMERSGDLGTVNMNKVSGRLFKTGDSVIQTRLWASEKLSPILSYERAKVMRLSDKDITRAGVAGRPCLALIQLGGYLNCREECRPVTAGGFFRYPKCHWGGQARSSRTGCPPRPTHASVLTNERSVFTVSG